MSFAVSVAAGSIVAYRLANVAHAIDLPVAEALWRARGRGGERRGLASTPKKAVSFGVPPLALTLGQQTLALGAGLDADCVATARLYDFGIITIALRLDAGGLSWEALAAALNAVDRATGTDDDTLGEPWTSLLTGVRDVVQPALIRPSGNLVWEDYLIATVHSFAEPMPAGALDALDFVPLLSGDTRPLAPAARAELLKNRFSYYADDLAILTWHRAFILEPRGDADVSDVLEVANAQLLEMRFYDELLDAELPRMYALVEGARRTTSSLRAARRFANLARRFTTLVAEVTELAERVDNALQVTEDVYLARVYAAALEALRVPPVTAAVNRKIAIIRATYTALYDEAQSRRGEILEVLILGLIAIEVFLALASHL